MRLPILLALLIALAWASLALVRETAVVTELRVRHVLADRYRVAARERQTERHNRIVEYYARGGTPPLPLSVHSDVPLAPRPLPVWVQRHVEVRPTERGETYHYRQSLGRALAAVPAWFFHGAFALLAVVLASLALVEALRLSGS